MAEVISQFDIHSWNDEIVCKRCDTVYRIDIADVEYDGFKVSGYWFDDTAEVENHYFVTCPACGHYTFVDDVHVLIKKAVRER